jgi:hypothetical protein
VLTSIFLLGVFIYTAWNYKALSAEEGWGIVAMFGLAGIGLIIGVTDLILQQFVKNKNTLALIELIIIVGLVIAMLMD